MTLTNFVNSKRDLVFWNTALDKTLKQIENLALFKAKIKDSLLSSDSKLLFF